MAQSAQPFFSRMRRYRGGCECGSVVYEANLDLLGTHAYAPTVWEREVHPGSFKLLRGADSLRGYQFSASDVHHFYCACCGTRAYSHVRSPQCGEFYTVDLQSLHASGAPLS